MTTIAIDSENNKYLVDVIRGRFNPAEQPDIIIKCFKKFKHRKVKIETVAYQEALRAGVKKKMMDEGIYIPGLEKGCKH